jgi:hypothetical protein
MYVKPEAPITVFELLMMRGVSPKYIEQLRNNGIINFTTELSSHSAMRAAGNHKRM